MLKEALGYKFKEKPKVNTLKEKLEGWELKINELAEANAFKPTEANSINNVIWGAKTFYESGNLPAFAKSEEQMFEYVENYIMSQLDRYIPVLGRNSASFSTIVESLGNYKVFGSEVAIYIEKTLDTNLFNSDIKKLVEQSSNRAKLLREELKSYQISDDVSLDEAFYSNDLPRRLCERYEKLVTESNRIFEFIETVQGLVNELR